MGMPIVLLNLMELCFSGRAKLESSNWTKRWHGVDQEGGARQHPRAGFQFQPIDGFVRKEGP
jgi:hypothetical protein